MKLKLNLLICVVFFVFASCATTQNVKSNGEKNVDLPPNVIFAQKLQSLLNNGDINGAILLFGTLTPPLSDDVDLKILKASLLLSANRLDEASDIASALLKQFPKNQDVLELNAEIALASGDKNAKNNIVNELLKADPNNPTANVIQGNQQALNKKYKLAKNNYQKALIREPNNHDALFGYAQMCYYTDDLKTSKETFEKLIRNEPNNAIAYQYLGKLYAEDENYKPAIENIQKAISLDANQYDFYIDLGNYMRNTGKYKDAEIAWSKAISIDPTYFLGYTYRAGLFDEQNMIKEALSDYHKVVETNPKYYFAFEEIGILEFHEKNWSSAREYFLKADAIKSSAAYQMMVILTYLQERKTLDAKNYAQKCMKTMNRETLEYKIMRLLHDQGPVNAETALANDLNKEQDKNKRGKIMFYFGMYYKLKGMQKVANEYFSKITEMQTPLFFEYRLAEWEKE